MYSFVHKCAAVALAMLLLASTTSWKVDKHYCMGHLVDLTFFGDTIGCGMDMEDQKGAASFCCDDETIIIDAQDNLGLVSTEDNTTLFAPLSLTNYNIPEYLILEQRDTPVNTYPPPLLVQDLQLLHEIFLI